MARAERDGVFDAERVHTPSVAEVLPQEIPEF
jgi:hypothetical protein